MPVFQFLFLPLPRLFRRSIETAACPWAHLIGASVILMDGRLPIDALPWCIMDDDDDDAAVQHETLPCTSVQTWDCCENTTETNENNGNKTERGASNGYGSGMVPQPNTRRLMMRRRKHYWKDPVTGEPFVNQQDENGWGMSWNPDDNRWYVHDKNGDVVATYSERRNAVQYARQHTVK